MFRRLASAALLSIAVASSALASDKLHRIAIQVDQNDPQVMDLALNNATNVIEYYRDKNEESKSMSSPMARACTCCDQIPRQCRTASSGSRTWYFRARSSSPPATTPSRAWKKTEGHAISVVPDATVVPSGVVHLMELQEQGWSYVRP